MTPKSEGARRVLPKKHIILPHNVSIHPVSCATQSFRVILIKICCDNKCGSLVFAASHDSHATMTDEVQCEEDERDIELSTIAAIFPEVVIDPSDSHSAFLDLDIAPTKPLCVSFTSDLSEDAETATLTYLPPLCLKIHLPQGYPEELPPTFLIDSSPAWLPPEVLIRLNDEGRTLWEEYGRGQIVYAYIDFLQAEAEKGFALGDTPLVLPSTLQAPLVAYDRRAKRTKFEKETFTCGICLEPKKGSACYRLQHCQHVFCVACLQDFYSSAIVEGDVASVKCLDPDCGMENLKAYERRSKKQHTLHPVELLEIPLESAQVQRYLDLKLKKKLESDPNTIWCPRTWCQGPARTRSSMKITLDNLADLQASDDEDDTSISAPERDKPSADAPFSSQRPPPDRLQVCSVCLYAFCRVCTKSWHGELQHCFPRNPTELSAEEQASYDFIRLHTSPCPSCASPCQKTHGCNHMCCATCKSHFCYLCSAWLQSQNPYLHFNTKGTECYMRLWELEEGDEGDQALGRRANIEVGQRAAAAAAAAAAAIDEAQAVALPVAARADQGRGGLQRFLELAANDEEDGWDSDELEAELVAFGLVD